MLSRRFYDSALKSPHLGNKGGLAIIEESWEMKDWYPKIRPLCIAMATVL